MPCQFKSLKSPASIFLCLEAVTAGVVNTNDGSSPLVWNKFLSFVFLKAANETIDKNTRWSFNIYKTKWLIKRFIFVGHI